ADGDTDVRACARESVALAEIVRAAVVAGWALPRSLANGKALNARLHQTSEEHTPLPLNLKPDIVPGHSHEAGEPAGEDSKFSGDINFVVDSTTEVLLERMQTIARLIGLVSLLVALPLLWMAWVLAGNLAGLLMLNERRTLGLMRLRGISGALMGRALLVSIVTGGFIGGLLGLAAG